MYVSNLANLVEQRSLEAWLSGRMDIIDSPITLLANQLYQEPAVASAIAEGYTHPRPRAMLADDPRCNASDIAVLAFAEGVARQNTGLATKRCTIGSNNVAERRGKVLGSAREAPNGCSRGIIPVDLQNEGSRVRAAPSTCRNQRQGYRPEEHCPQSRP